MQITQKELSAVLKQVKQLKLPARTTHPILHGCLITVTPGTIIFNVTDLTTWLQLTVASDSWKPEASSWKAAVNLANFANLATKLKAKVLHLTATDKELILSNESLDTNVQYGVAKLATEDEDVPLLPLKELTTLIPNLELDKVELSNALNAVIYAASTDDTKQVLTAINFKVVSNQLIVTATDGHRAAVYTTNVEAIADTEFNLPLSGAKTLVKILSKAKGTVSIIVNNNYFVYEMGTNCTLVVRCRDNAEQYPNLAHIIPNHECGLDVDLDSFMDAVVAAQAYATMLDTANKMPRIHLKIGAKLQVYVEATRVAVLEGNPEYDCVMALNVNYLLETLTVLSKLKYSSFKLRFNNGTYTGLVSLETPGTTAYLMPMQIKE